MRTLIFQRILTHYRVQIFNRLTQHLNLTICHSSNKYYPSRQRDAQIYFSNFTTKNLGNLKNDNCFVFQNIFTPIIKIKPSIVVLEFSLRILSNYLIFLLKPIYKYKIVLWTHGWNRRKGFNPNVSFVDKIRLYFINKADAVILYSYSARKELLKWVKNPNKLFVAPNTLETDELIRIRKQCEGIGKLALKKKWGITQSYIIIFIGRLIKDKKVEMVLDIFSRVQKKSKNCALVIVGDGSEMAYLKRLNRILRLKYVYFLGEIIDVRQTGELLFIADILLNPGYVGLSVVHAFCFDTPVVTQKCGSNGPYHSPEIEYVVHGKTGYLCENGNLDEMANIILDLIKRNERRLIKMRINIRKKVLYECNISNFVSGFTDAIKSIQLRN